MVMDLRVGIINTLKYAELNVPILVQAVDDDNDKVDVNSRRDAFCGKLSVSNNLYQYGIPFTDTTYHTCKINSEVFRKDIEYFAAVCRVVGGLKHARIGAVGARPGLYSTGITIMEKTGICVYVHIAAPKSFFENEIEISNLDVLGTVLGQENCFGAVKGKVNAGTATYFRISTDDRYGMIKSYLGEAEFTNDPYGMDGGIAVTVFLICNSSLSFYAKKVSNIMWLW